LLSIIFSPELKVVSFGLGAAAFDAFFAGSDFAGAGFAGSAFGASAFDGSAGLGGSGTGGSTGGGAAVAGSAGAGSDFAGSVLSVVEEQLATKTQRPAINNRKMLFFISRRV
jgi:hypothetical protein